MRIPPWNVFFYIFFLFWSLFIFANYKFLLSSHIVSTVPQGSLLRLLLICSHFPKSRSDFNIIVKLCISQITGGCFLIIIFIYKTFHQSDHLYRNEIRENQHADLKTCALASAVLTWAWALNWWFYAVRVNVMEYGVDIILSGKAREWKMERLLLLNGSIRSQFV